MRTVEEIIKLVYRRKCDAARALGVVPHAVSMWEHRGIPGHLLQQIMSDAEKQRVKLELSEIPINSRRRA